MPDFDPDAYLQANGGGSAVAAPPPQGSFDPDAYLKTYAPTPSASGGFDPDSYLSENSGNTLSPADSATVRDATSKALAMLIASPAGIIAQAQGNQYNQNVSDVLSADQKTRIMMQFSPAGFIAQAEAEPKIPELQAADSTAQPITTGGSSIQAGAPVIAGTGINPMESVMPIPEFPERPDGQFPYLGTAAATLLGVPSLARALDPVVRAEANIPIGLANFVTSPIGAATTAAASAFPIVGTAIAMGFGAQGLKGLYDEGQKIVSGDETTQGAIQSYGTNLLMVLGGAAAHAEAKGMAQAKVDADMAESLKNVPTEALQATVSDPQAAKAFGPANTALASQELARRASPDGLATDAKARIDSDLATVLNQHPEQTAAQVQPTPVTPETPAVPPVNRDLQVGSSVTRNGRDYIVKSASGDQVTLTATDSPSEITLPRAKVILEQERVESSANADAANAKIEAGTSEAVSSGFRDLETGETHDTGTNNPHMLAPEASQAWIDQHANIEPGWFFKDGSFKSNDDILQERAADTDKQLTGVSEGPGAAASSEFTPQQTTGLKRATVDVERLSRGAEPIPTADRLSRDEAVRQAEDRVDSDKTAAPSLVARIVDGGDRAISHEDAATLLVERQRLMNERTQWEDVRGDETASPAQRQNASTQLDGIETQMDRLDQAQRSAGSGWSDVGRMYQQMIKEDFTLDSMLRKERAVKGGALTESERDSVAQANATITDLQNRLDAERTASAEAKEKQDVSDTYTKTIEDLKSELAGRPKFGKDVFDIARGIVNKWKADADLARQSLRDRIGRTSAGLDPTALLDVARIMRAHIGELGLDLTEASAKLVEEFGDAVKPYLEKAWAKARQMIDAEKAPGKAKEAIKRGVPKTPLDIKSRTKAEAVSGEDLSHKTVYELARAHINAGVHGEDAVMKAVHFDVKEFYPDATERDVRRAFSEYGKAKFPSKEADKVELAQLRNLTRLQESIDRLKEGKDALKTGLQRDKATQEIREKQAQLNELLKKRQGPPSPERLASQNEARQTALRNRIADIDKELRTGEGRPNTEPAKPDDATEALMSERDAMQAKLNEIRKEENPGKTDVEKQVDQLSKIKDRLDKKLSGEIPSSAAKDFKPLSQAAEDIKAEIHAMQELAAQIKRDANPKDPNAAAKKAQVKSLEDQISRYEEKTKAADFSSQGKTRGPDEKQISDLKAIRDARKAVYEAAKKASRPVLTPEERYNTTRQKMLAKQLKDVQDRIAANKYDRPIKRVAPDKNDATRKLEVQLAGEKNKFTEGLMRKERANQPAWQKVLRGTSEAAKGMAIGGYHSLIKISGFSLAKIVEAHLQEATGVVTNRLTGSARGSLESGAGFNAAMKGYRAGLSRGVKEALGVYRTGRSESDLLYGKPRLNDAHWYDWIGSRAHSAEKHPTFSADEQRYRTNGFVNAEHSGLDISNEFVRATINKAAFDRAQSAKLQENNMVADLVSQIHARLEKDQPDTGRPDAAKFATSVALKTLLTKGIVKTPANYISQVMQRTPLGLGVGVGKLATAYVRGIDTLKPAEIDAIHKALKVGAVGTAMFAWGAIDATHKKEDRIFGGYYEPGRKTGDGDAKWGTLRIAGLNIPHIFTHNLLTEPAQIGSTMVRVAQSRFRKSDPDTKGALEGSLQAIVALGSQAPVAGPIMRMGRPGSSISGQLVGGLVPQLLSNLAEDTDSKERSPKTTTQKVMSEIPGLRQMVPEKRAKPQRPIR